MKELSAQNTQIFNFNSNEIRTITIDGEPWFIAKDVCNVLEVSNVSDALSRLDDDEKNTIALTDGTSGNPVTSIINESGLYSLTLSSRKPQAKPFKKWVTSEVLPTIRKTGSYSAKPMSHTEMLLASAQALLAIEQEQTRQASELLEIKNDVEDIKKRKSDGEIPVPEGYASLKNLSERFKKHYGISSAVPKHVIKNKLALVSRTYRRFVEEAGGYVEAEAYPIEDSIELMESFMKSVSCKETKNMFKHDDYHEGNTGFRIGHQDYVWEKSLT